MLTGAMVAIAPGSPMQLLIAVMICLAYLLSVTHASPFKGHLEDRLAFVVSLSLTLSLVIGLAILMDDPDNIVFNVDHMGVLLITINAIPLCFLLVFALEIVRYGPLHKLEITEKRSLLRELVQQTVAHDKAKAIRLKNLSILHRGSSASTSAFGGDASIAPVVEHEHVHHHHHHHHYDTGGEDSGDESTDDTSSDRESDDNDGENMGAIGVRVVDVELVSR